MIGIDISDRSIKIAEITEGTEPSLRTVGWSPLSVQIMRRGIILDPGQAATEVRAAFEKCSPVRVAGTRVVVSIPETQSFVRVVELPVMSERELDEAVMWAVRQHIPFDLDRVYLDWQVIMAVQKRPEYQHILVGATQRDVVDPLLEVIDTAGLQVVALELEAQSLVRSLLPYDATGVRGVLLIDLGATSTNVVFFDDGAMRSTTSIQRGGDDFTQFLAEQLHLQPAVAAEKKALVGTTPQVGEQAVAASLRESVGRLAQEINQVMQEALVQLTASDGIRAVLLSGGSANLPGIREVFAEVFAGIPVQLGNPLVNLVHEEKDSSPLSAADAQHFTTAIGLALRRE